MGEATEECEWMMGGVTRPLERLMFGESPGCRVDLLDTPPSGDQPLAAAAAAAAPKALRAAPAVQKAPEGRLRQPRRCKERLALWFSQGPNEELIRLSEEEEAEMDRGLDKALNGLRLKGIKATGPAAAAQLLSDFSATTSLEGLCCVPLDGDLCLGPCGCR